MQLKQLFTDDEGVSPVIGVILMVAITVILAAVIAAFVLGLGDSSDVSPQTSFDFDFEDDENGGLTITATSGDTIDASQVAVEIGGTEANVDWGNEEVSAGSSVTLDAGHGNDDQIGADNEGDTVNVVWESDDGDDSSILGSFDIPDDTNLPA